MSQPFKFWLSLCALFMSVFLLHSFFAPPKVLAVPPATSCGPDSYDMLTYFFGDGTQTNAISTDQYYTSVEATINGKSGFYIVKNKPGNVFEQFTYDANYIYHLRDTSWATENGNVQCNGHDAGFSLLDGCFGNNADAQGKMGTDVEGQKWVPRCMKKGEQYSFPGTVVGFDKTTCQACNAPFTGCATRIVELTDVYTKDNPVSFKDGVTSTNAIKIEIKQGPGSGEAYVYDKQHGWIGFGRSANIDSYAVRYEPALSYDVSGQFACTLNSTSSLTSTPTQVNRDEFYITPIKGVNPNNRDLIRDDLIRQGYEARCATPGFDIVLNMDGVDWMKKYLKCASADPTRCNSPLGQGGVFGGIGIAGAPDLIGPNAQQNRVVSTLSIDYRDALVPVMRDLDQVPQLKRSLEDYFGYKAPANDSYSVGEIKSAPINSLLTRGQRCTQAALSLLQRDEMCKKLNKPSACALYETKVPETDFTVKSLLDEYSSQKTKIASEKGIDPTDNEAVCAEIIKESSDPKKTALRNGMLNLNLHIENAYRLAFLVTTIRTKVPTTASMMNLFQHPKRGLLGIGPDPAHVVLINAFKVPDITTNKGTIDAFGEPKSGSTDFNDPAILTRDVLIPSTIKQKIDQQGAEERKKMLDAARIIGAQEQDDDKMEIQCEISGIGGYQCLDPFTRAVVDIINAQSIIDKESANIDTSTLSATQIAQLDKLNCDGKPAEEPSFIFDPAGLKPLKNDGRTFNTEFGVNLLESMFTDETHMVSADGPTDPGYADTNDKKTGKPQWFWGLKSIFHVVPSNSFSYDEEKDKRTVKHFIVYPEGYDEKSIEAVMSGTFFTSNQIVALRDKAKKYEMLKIKDDKIVFDGGRASKHVTDITEMKTPGHYCNTEYDVVHNDGSISKKEDPCDEGDFSFELTTSRSDFRHAGILGGRLGYWLYTIQLSLQKSEALTHKYLTQCTSIEDFLLDQCGGTAKSEVATVSDYDSVFNKISSFTIPYWNGIDVTFQPPSRELWTAITNASAAHGCDPWLLLATAHGESPTFTNETIPNADGGVGLFEFDDKTWTKWMTSNENGVTANAAYKQKTGQPLSNSCDYWEPTSFSDKRIDFSSRTNIQASVDSACRKILWTGMQASKGNSQEFAGKYATKGASNDQEVWREGDAARADYVYRLWNELLSKTGESAKSQPAGYPYPVCKGEPPQPVNNNTEMDYFGRTILPMEDGVVTYYDKTMMNQTWDYRNNKEVNPSFIKNCEIITSGDLAQQFKELQDEARRNGTKGVVGCAAMFRRGDIPFYGTGKKDEIRLVWVKRPPGAPSGIPDVLGPIAIIDVAAENDAPNIWNRYDHKWVLDLDYYTFERLFGWQGTIGVWGKPQHGIKVCDTKEECQ